jgi:hypothetical protein
MKHTYDVVMLWYRHGSVSLCYSVIMSQCCLLFCLQEVDMESQFLSLGMDIIGLGVFNYDFRSLTTESPVIKVPFSLPI